MASRIVHLCYAGTSGSTRAAINISAGSAGPSRHAYVFYGTCPMRRDYGGQLDELGCAWRYVHKPRGWLNAAYGRVAKAIVDLSPAAAVLHGSRSLPVGMWLRWMGRGVAIVAVQHGPSRELTSWWRRRVCLRFSRLADRTVTVSAGMASLIGNRPALASAAAPLAVIPNGIDVDYWWTNASEMRTDGPVRLVMVATLDRHKGHAVLLRAVGRIREAGVDVRCELAGAGHQEKHLRSLAEKLGIGERIMFLGDLDRRGVRQALSRAHIVCHAAQSESFGMSVLEAMAAGRPIVATDVVGVGELIEDGRTGLLVRPGEPAALADAVRWLIDNPTDAAAMAEAARREARARYSMAAMASAYEVLIDRILSDKAQRDGR